MLADTDRTRVVRQRVDAPAGTRIVKQTLGPDAHRRLRRERGMLERLAGVPGVARLAPAAAHDVIVLHDDDGVSLAQALAGRPMETTALVEFAHALARVLAGVHGAGVIHKDVNPANVLLRHADGRAVLIDFDIATASAELRPDFKHAREIEGTLAYMAPEQTGRTGRQVDHRADLYALGATLYEAATGRPPFEGDDPLQLVRDQLARVPVAPAALVPTLPQPLSDIVMRLLEKEPDRRYQSAEGLAADLALLRDRLRAGDASAFPLARRDFARHLASTARVVGREAELAQLRQALHEAIAGRPRGVLVHGGAGVGKTALANELRAIVSQHHGWFIGGRFEPGVRGEQGAAIQCLRALGRLLLAEPEDTLAALRERALAGVGANAGLLARLVPEFAALLPGQDTEAAETEKPQAEQRIVRGVADLLRAVVSSARPLVMVLDDLEHASAITLRVVDVLFAQAPVPGLLVVGVYGDDTLAPPSPLADALARWRQLAPGPTELVVHNLGVADVAVLLGEMLRLPPDPAQALAAALVARTGGNPLDTVELLNALRRDGLLAARDDGWQWDAAEIRRYVGGGRVVDLLGVRLERLPAASVALLERLACLGMHASLRLLAVACGHDEPEALEPLLQPALEDGLIVREDHVEPLVRLRHERVRQAVLARLDDQARASVHLALARRAAAHADLQVVAAEQYHASGATLASADERLTAARLLRAAALQYRRHASYDSEERYLRAALALLHGEADAHEALVLDLRIAHHAALFSLGRGDEADAVYDWIRAHCHDDVARVPPTCVQINNLTNRSRQREAQELGFALLERLGLPLPASGFDASKKPLIDALKAWIASPEKVRDHERPTVTDTRVLATARLLHYTLGPTFYCGDPRGGLLVLYCHQLWVQHGPCAPLLTGFGGIPLITVSGGDYRGGWIAIRHALDVAERRGYEPETSWVRHCMALFVQHWAQPLESCVAEARRAREGLLQGGDLQYACFSYHTEIAAQMDVAASLDELESVLDAASAFASRTGNGFFEQVTVQYRQLLDGLRSGQWAALLDPSAQPPDPRAPGINPTAVVTFHLVRAIAAALQGDDAALMRHASAAVPLLPFVAGYYPVAQVRWLHGLALARRMAQTEGEERDAIAQKLDTIRHWLHERAADAPANFRHLATWLDAEHVLATAGALASMPRYDLAQREAAQHCRPWHRALLAERVARVCRQAGLERGARPLYTEARNLYASWGAAGKAAMLDREHQLPTPRAGFGPRATQTTLSALGTDGGFNATTLDMAAILRASQALSSETSLPRLKLRVRELLGAMTGADRVQLLLRAGTPPAWCLASGAAGQPRLPLDEAVRRGLVPVSAFRYAERTGQPLLVDDAVTDDRFARDPYFSGAERCSLLIVPIASHGEQRAMLVLENRLARGAFSVDRLDAVMMIAGQLAVSLDNAVLYDSLERQVAERTRALGEANRRLSELSVTDALTGLANRRRLEEALATEWARAQRAGTPVGLAMIDIDQFKPYNDHYGHLRGDDCLRVVAQALRQALRRGELLARYGGEEFVFVMPDTDLAGALAASERLRAAVAALREPHEASALGTVSVSVGAAAVVPSPDEAWASLLQRADAALYEAKRLGRNRVEGA